MERESNYYDVPVELKDNVDRILTRSFYNSIYVENGSVYTFETNADEYAFSKVLERAKAEKRADDKFKDKPVTRVYVTEKEYENDWFVDALLATYGMTRDDLTII